MSSEGGAENSLNAPVAAEGESAAQPSRGTSNSRGLCSGCRVFRLIPFRLIPLLRPSTALLG